MFENVVVLHKNLKNNRGVSKCGVWIGCLVKEVDLKYDSAPRHQQTLKKWHLSKSFEWKIEGCNTK